jgi:hypothetical protein
MLSAIGSAFWIARDSKDWPLTDRQKWMVHGACLYGGIIGCMIPTIFSWGGVEESLRNAISQEFHSGPFDFLMHSLLGPKTVIGGLIGGFFGVALVKKVFGIAFDTSDAFTRGTAWMLFVGRMGCAFQHCCYGRIVPVLGLDQGDGNLRFPIQAFEATINGLVFLIFHHLHRKNIVPNQRLFALYVTYGGTRFLTEFLREPMARSTGLGFYQLWAGGLLLVGLLQIWKRTKKSGSVDLSLEKSTEPLLRT